MRLTVWSAAASTKSPVPTEVFALETSNNHARAWVSSRSPEKTLRDLAWLASRRRVENSHAHMRMNCFEMSGHPSGRERRHVIGPSATRIRFLPVLVSTTTIHRAWSESPKRRPAAGHRSIGGPSDSLSAGRSETRYAPSGRMRSNICATTSDPEHRGQTGTVRAVPLPRRRQRAARCCTARSTSGAHAWRRGGRRCCHGRSPPAAKAAPLAPNLPSRAV
jgi:hypothetical protein